VRESLKALLAIGWTVEHSDVEVPSNNRNSTRRTSKANPVSITCYLTFSSACYIVLQFFFFFFAILYILTPISLCLSVFLCLSLTHTNIPIQEPLFTNAALEIMMKTTSSIYVFSYLLYPISFFFSESL
jgi:hypothetical protein